MDNKICNQCDIEKPLYLFHKEKKAPDGYRSKCKSCICENVRLYKQKNKNKLKEYNKKYILDHPEFRVKKLQIGNEWRRNNPDKMEIQYAKRRVSPQEKASKKAVRELNKANKLEKQKEIKKAKYDTIMSKYNGINASVYGEIWDDIQGYEGLYRISSHGRVYSLISNMMLNPYTCNIGYRFVNLHKDKLSKKYRVHRLVAITFIPNDFNKPDINHIDFDKINNKINNLEWVTAAENNIHRIVMKNI